MASLRLGAVALALAAVALPSAARAQDAVTAGIAQYRDADFATARRTLTAALDGDALSRTDVGRALGTLAAADFALGDVDAMRAHVAALAVVAPTYAFGREIPPELLDAFAEARQATRPPVLRVETAGAGASREVTVVLAGARAGLRELVIDCVDDLGARRVDRGPTPLVRVERSAHCEARAVWLGGAVVARASTEVDLHPRPAAATATRPAWESARRADEGPPWVWIGVGIGAAVLVGVIVVVAVAASSGDPTYQLGGPVVTW